MKYSLFVYLNNMINSLIEAVEYVEKNEDKKMCRKLLMNCEQVLEVIEKTLLDKKGSVKETKIFDRLQNCKEQVFELNNLLQTTRNYHKFASRFCENIKALQCLYLNGINVIYNVVFYAELGQKWDSMNSVYQAFKKRKDCDVRVVLSPIFRAVKSEGRVKTEVIYEDYLTPMGISHIPFMQYDISKQLPDIVFISNPYESVTPPQFWPENIAKYSRLVYLPYYTGSVISSETIKVHCGLPVAKHAWKIMAQSEKVKEMHKKYAPKQGENILVTGLPKWDDIILMNQDTVELDSNWEKKLTGRKVFLWNSHYAANDVTSTLLENGKSIIDLFRDRDDIALIWRPHPMTETIFKLYLPQSFSTWEELKEDVEKADNMVLDTNTSYKMAFQISDALISDWSSLMTQYLLTQKPILFLKKATETDNIILNSEQLVRLGELEQANTPIEIAEFIDRISHGIDLNKELRLKIMREDMFGSDGKVGERVCDLLLEELQIEDRVRHLK